MESFHYPATDLITRDLTSLLKMDEKPGVDFGHDNDPLGGVRQELRRLVPHRCLRAVPRITAVSVSFFDPGN